jgi:predicted  nucleic acid-binding Zn-ribbon protein
MPNRRSEEIESDIVAQRQKLDDALSELEDARSEVQTTQARLADLRNELIGALRAELASMTDIATN